jgi:hypothetical protein
MSSSHPAISGALGGFILGAAEYVIAMGVMRRAVAREVEEGGDLPGMTFVAGRFVKIRRALAAFSFLFLPALGLALGAALGSTESSL